MATAFDKDWDWYSDLIDDRKESADWAVVRRARETHWADFFDIAPGERLLDAGCGNGDYTRLAADAGARIWAFDLSERMVANTGERLRREGVALEELLVASVTDIPYPDEHFDTVMCLAVLDHVPDEERPTAMAELARVLRPGGTLYVNTPNRYAYHWRLGHWLMRQIGLFPKGRVGWHTPRELCALATGAGLDVDDTLGLEFLPPFSGLYTADLRRITFLPPRLVAPLDRLYIRVERWARRRRPLKPLCLHLFVRAVKGDPDAASGRSAAARDDQHSETDERDAAELRRVERLSEQQQ